MAKASGSLKISTPGRVCLFGEHQDYLGLPVIPCAISLRISIEGTPRTDHDVRIQLPDIGSTESFSLKGPLPYTLERDYFRSAVNVLRRHGYLFSRGVDCTVKGAIPINAGTSSSSALLVSWVNFLARMSDQHDTLAPEAVARYAHEAEVVEFNEPGGMMDHYSTALGGIIAIDFYPEFRVTPLWAELGTFVLGDSGEPKDTKGILARVKNRVLDIAGRLKAADPRFSLLEATSSGVGRRAAALERGEYDLLAGTVRNHEITLEALSLFKQTPLDHLRLGNLLTTHQAVLRDVLKISTPKIDRMISAALDAGAYGGKINGSGGGGCMFVYAPVEPERVAQAIDRVGGKAFIVRADEGTRVDEGEAQG
jgi:galactokinase